MGIRTKQPLLSESCYNNILYSSKKGLFLQNISYFPFFFIFLIQLSFYFCTEGQWQTDNYYASVSDFALPNAKGIPDVHTLIVPRDSSKPAD
jgi:hypothetical protein